MVIHHIIHWQILTVKYLNSLCINEPVVSVVNFVHSYGLKDHHFCKFSSEIEAEYPDLPYHTAVCNLFELGAEIKTFLYEDCPHLLCSNTE